MTGSRDVDLIRRIEALEETTGNLSAEIRDLNAVKNMGRGVLWFVLKIGSLVALAGAAIWAMISEN